MSWYNDETDNSFIDSTQEHIGGSGGSGGSSGGTIVNEGDTSTTIGDTTTISTNINTGFDTTLNDLIQLKVDGNTNFHTYLNNNNDDGEIRFHTKNAMNINDFNYNYFTLSYSNPRLTYNTKINKDGILQYYHTYSLFYPQKLSGWYSVDYDISALETAQNIAILSLGVVEAQIVTIEAEEVLFRNSDYYPFKVATLEAIAFLDTDVSMRALRSGGPNQLPTNTDRATSIRGALADILTAQGVGVRNTTTTSSLVRAGGNLPTPAGVSITTSGAMSYSALRGATGQAFRDKIQNAVAIGTIGVGIYGIYSLIDKQNQERANSDEVFVNRIRRDMYDAKNDGQGNTGFITDNSHLYKDSISIDQTTNNGFTTAGFYEVEIDHDEELSIVIKDNGSGTLIAEIFEVLNYKKDFSVNDEIFIDKSNIGGTTGQLKIVVNALRSMEYIYQKLEEEIDDELFAIDNRKRRRQFIPDKNNFGNGINITETNITETSGEITKDLDISLKIDTSHFAYDGSGNLQLKNFTNIGNTGNLGIPSDNIAVPPVLATGLNLQVESNTGNIATNTGNIGTLQTNLGVASSILPVVVATGLNLDFETLRGEVGDNTSIPKTGIHKSINDIESLLGTIPDYDADGNVVDLATGIYARIDNIYKVVMEEGFTFDNNNDYKLSLGYDVVWNGFYYNLFCIALKTIRTGAFQSSFYGNDYMGLFPSLERVADKTTEFLLVKDTGIELLTNFHIKRGVLYFDNINPTINYDLARKVEFVVFLTPKNIDNLDVEYTILQTGIEISTNTYDIDNNKLKLSIINNKLNITNYIYYNSYYYQSLTTTLFNTYMLATFSSSGSFNLPSSIGFKEAVNTINGREHSIGIKSVQVSPTNVPTDQTWYDIVRSGGAQTSSFYYWNFDILRDMTYQPQTWKSPVFYYKENLPLPANRNNFSKITIRYDYENFTTSGGWTSTVFGSQNAIDTGLEFKMKITRKQYNDPTNSFGSILVDFNQTTKVAGKVWYEMDIWIDNNSPIASSTKYNWVELELVHKGGSFTPLPSGVQSYTNYNSQSRIKVYTFGVFEYDTTTTNISNWKSHTFQDDINDFFPTPIEQNTPHKAVFNLDLPNKLINYYIDDDAHTLTLQNEISIIGTSFSNEDPNQTTHPATFEFVNDTYTILNQNNNILIIGNEPISGELNYSHFNWKFIPNGSSENFMTLSQRNKLDELITYNYYYETVSVPRYLKTKELYADVFDARRLLINGGALYNDLSPAEQSTRLRTNDQSTGNVLIGNSFLEIGKLFVDNPTISGNLTYDFNTKVFSISQGGSINTDDVENIIDGLIKTTPSTYGLIFNDTDVNDKYLQLDNTYINTLINLVLQNEVSFNTGFTNVNFNDILIQVKDASIYSPYNLRELVDVNTLYNYIVNGSHNYLIRELNQLVQYHPLLGPAFGDYLPTGSFNFNGILTEDQGNSSIDFQVITTGAQITYGNGYDNNKLQNGLSGGLSYIQNINVFPFSDGYSGCISCFHKPYGSFTGGNIYEVLDVNGVNLLRLRISYSSGFARYVLDVFNQSNSNFTQYIFNNSENEVYYQNENSILIYYNFPNIYMYVNGFKHDGNITTYTNQTFQNARFKINTSTYNNKSLLYELKVYDRLLFKSNDDIFNFKRVAEITEFYRINPVSGSGLIIKELSGLQETKSRSITNKQTISTLSSYSDTKVRNVLSSSGGNNITWNTGTNQFDSTIVQYEDADVETYLQGKAGVGMTYNTNTQLFDCDIIEYNSTNLETALKFKGGTGMTYNVGQSRFDCDILQYEDADVETYLQGKAGVGMTYNTNTQLFDCDIIEYNSTNLETALKFKGGTGMTYNVGQSRFDCDILQYDDADVRSILAVSDGDGIDWDSATNKFKLSGNVVTLANQYDETDVETFLATKGGSNIYYNPTTKKFDNSITAFDQLSGTITYATIFDPPDLSNYITLVDIPVQYSTTILETELANKAGTLLDWNNTSKQFDVSLNNTYYDFRTSGKTILNQLVVIDDKALQFGQSSNPPKINIYDAYIPNVNIVEYTNTEYFSLRKRDGSYMLVIDDSYNTSVGGRITLNNYGTQTGIRFSDSSLQETAAVQGNWNETNNASLSFIRNKPTIPASPVQSDFNENNNSSLAYIQNKPTLPTLLSNESGVILNLNGLTFTNPNAFIKEGSMQINGTAFTSASTTTIVEDFTYASGSINTTISGLNTTFFTNGILGSQAPLSGGIGYNLGQISGLYNSYKSEFRTSGSGTGTSGTFNSSPIGYSKFFCFNGGTYRSLRTKNMQSIMGDIVSLSFYWIAGNNSNGGNRPESNENFELQFLDSFGNLLSNTVIHYGSVLYPNVANFTYFTMNLNASQQQSSYIRWFQLNTSSGPYDQYAFTGLNFTFQTPASGGADVRLINLPTVEPTDANKLWRDSNGFLKIS